jgi:hypothetical protein
VSTPAEDQEPAPYCELCDLDMHRCPGCGAPVDHTQVACCDCSATAIGA